METKSSYKASLANFTFLFLSLSATVLIALCLLFFIYRLEGSLQSKELEHSMRGDKVRAIAQYKKSQEIQSLRNYVRRFQKTDIDSIQAYRMQALKKLNQTLMHPADFQNFSLEKAALNLAALQFSQWNFDENARSMKELFSTTETMKLNYSFPYQRSDFPIAEKIAESGIEVHSDPKDRAIYILGKDLEKLDLLDGKKDSKLEDPKLSHLLEISYIANPYNFTWGVPGSKLETAEGWDLLSFHRTPQQIERIKKIVSLLPIPNLYSQTISRLGVRTSKFFDLISIAFKERMQDDLSSIETQNSLSFVEPYPSNYMTHPYKEDRYLIFPTHLVSGLLNFDLLDRRIYFDSIQDGLRTPLCLRDNTFDQALVFCNKEGKVLEEQFSKGQFNESTSWWGMEGFYPRIYSVHNFAENWQLCTSSSLFEVVWKPLSYTLLALIFGLAVIFQTRRLSLKLMRNLESDVSSLMNTLKDSHSDSSRFYTEDFFRLNSKVREFRNTIQTQLDFSAFLNHILQALGSGQKTKQLFESNLEEFQSQSLKVSIDNSDTQQTPSNVLRNRGSYQFSRDLDLDELENVDQLLQLIEDYYKVQSELLLRERLLSDLRLADLLQDALHKPKELLLDGTQIEVHPLPMDSLQENLILASDFQSHKGHISFYYFSLSTSNLTQSVLAAFDLKARLDAQIKLESSESVDDESIPKPGKPIDSCSTAQEDSPFTQDFIKNTYQSISKTVGAESLKLQIIVGSFSTKGKTLHLDFNNKDSILNVKEASNGYELPLRIGLNQGNLIFEIRETQ